MHIIAVAADSWHSNSPTEGQRAALRFSLLTAADGLPPLCRILAPPAAVLPLSQHSAPVVPLGPAGPLHAHPATSAAASRPQGGGTALREIVVAAVCETVGAPVNDDDTPLMAAGGVGWRAPGQHHRAACGAHNHVRSFHSFHSCVDGVRSTIHHIWEFSNLTPP